MAVQLTIQLTDEQQALMVQVARSVLGQDATRDDMLAWAEQVAADGLRSEVERIGLNDLDMGARETLNAQRRDFVSEVTAAWPTPGEAEGA